MGSPVTGYRIFLRKADLSSFVLDFSYCDGSQTDIFEARQCLIPSSSFISTLYGYQWGQQVHSKIIAYNIYGDSVESDLSNPTTLMTNPNEPVSFIENTNLRSFFDIAFTWVDGASNMGSVIIDYELSFALGIEADAIFSVFQENIVGRAVTATGLISGQMY